MNGNGFSALTSTLSQMEEIEPIFFFIFLLQVSSLGALKDRACHDAGLARGGARGKIGGDVSADI